MWPPMPTLPAAWRSSPNARASPELAALADQYADRRLGFLNAALYRIGTGPYYAKAFHDITTGTNTVTFSSTSIIGYQAANGWDPVTGWGSPDAQVLIPLLAREIHPGDGQGL